jgi:hypothetical protein
MSRSCVTIRTAVLTAAVRIQAGVKADIRAVVLGDDALRIVPEEFSTNGTRLRVRLAPILPFIAQGLKSVCWIDIRTPPTGLAFDWII